MNNFGIAVNENEIFRNVLLDEDGNIGFNEYINFMKTKKIDDYRDIFIYFDKD